MNPMFDSNQQVAVAISNQLEKDMKAAGVDAYTFGDLNTAQAKAMGDKEAVYSWDKEASNKQMNEIIKKQNERLMKELNK
ncbi:MAG: hypothetical protein GY886_01290 [Gammaproteobacteria bacterium]|nr:hypothetical protein [Gammaproteobacteria bacterium]